MVLPGVQALFGFQLIAAFNQRFADLSSLDRELHFSALLLTALVIGLLMTPAAYHRLCERTSISSYFATMSSRLIATAMVPLALAIAIEVYIVGEMIFPDLSSTYTSGFALAVFLVLSALWIAFPLAHKRSERRR